MKKQIITKKLDSEMQNSFWYQNEGDIAIIQSKDKEIIISTCGNIRIKFSGENFYRKNQQAVHKALILDLCDKDLHTIEFGESNWFDFVYKKGNGEYIEIDSDECFYYDEAIDMAKETIGNDEFWTQF